MLDVTHNKKIEDDVRQSAKFPGQNPNPVMRVSNDGTIIYANSASKTLLDLWDSRIGHRIPDNVYEIVHSVIDSGLHDSIEVSCGDVIFNIVFAPITEYDYVNLYARDVTEVKNAEMELIKANQILVEHDRLKSEFVSTVSHELRTPLFIFKNIISNAMAGVMGKISSKLYENLRVADMSIERLTRIISDFLDISRIESGIMELNISEFSIQVFVEEVAKSLLPLAEVKKIAIGTHVADDQLLVFADRDKIAQILTNLVGNAIKFIPVSGNIDIKVSAAVDNNVTISVCDNGPGLNAEESRKIFDRFVQGEIFKGEGYHGTGLGLTIAQNLVELHRGKIWVETSPGNGCQFHFTIPISAKQDQPQENMELVAD
jgi:signal transduction histidine kinase